MDDKKIEQEKMDLGAETGVENVEDYQFEPIKGYPMLNWRGKRPFTSTRYYPAQLKEVHGEEVGGWRRGGSVRLNSFGWFHKWITRSVMLRPVPVAAPGTVT
jgi:hypothetical protein